MRRINLEILRREKYICKIFHEQNQNVTGSTKKNQFTTSSMNKISLTMTKINVEVSRTKNQQVTSLTKKSVKISPMNKTQYATG